MKSENTILILALIVAVAICAGCNSGSSTPDAVEKQASIKQTMSTDMFMQAALDGNMATIKEALQNNTDVNTASEDDGKTALMLASFNGHSEIVKILIEAGALVQTKDATGRTALMYASTGTDTATVKLLLSKGAEVNEADSDEHFTPLMWAAAEGGTEICRLLLEAGADTSMKDVDGDTASTFAGKNGHTELAAMLKPSK